MALSMPDRFLHSVSHLVGKMYLLIRIFDFDHKVAKCGFLKELAGFPVLVDNF